MPETNHLLGTYLKDRRNRHDPAALAFSVARRRTPGMRSEDSAFAVDDRPDLGVIVCNPVTSSDAHRIQPLVASRSNH